MKTTQQQRKELLAQINRQIERLQRLNRLVPSQVAELRLLEELAKRVRQGRTREDVYNDRFEFKLLKAATKFQQDEAYVALYRAVVAGKVSPPKGS